MPEQQKVDETIESTSVFKKKISTKVEQSSTALEKELDNATETEVNDQGNATETEGDYLKEH